MQRRRALRYLISVIALLFSFAMIALWADRSGKMRDARVRCSYFTLGAFSDGQRRTITALWCKPGQADEVWRWVQRDVESGSRIWWGEGANRLAPFGGTRRSHTFVRPGWRPATERTVWFPLWSALTVGYATIAICVWLELRARHRDRTAGAAPQEEDQPYSGGRPM